jgi:hypothetical protein
MDERFDRELSASGTARLGPAMKFGLGAPLKT